MEVLKVSSSTIEKMKQHYASAIATNVPQGGVFLAKVSGCVITAYKSGKVMFQGANFQSEAAKWRSASTAETPKSKRSLPKSSSLPKDFHLFSAIGSDEVGTGDYFGPMVVVSAYVDSKQIPLLKELGVTDSKNLTDKQICEIAKQIITILPYSLLVLHNEKYNDLWEKGTNQGKMKALLHNQAILNTIKKIAPVKAEAILIDQFCQPGVYYNYLKGKKEIAQEDVYFSTKGESVHIAVAAASIIARYAFVQHFDQLSKEVGMTLPKGAGAKVDEAAATLIAKHGVDILQKVTKIHFANTEKAKSLYRKKYQ